jgi:hypothetical protein
MKKIMFFLCVGFAIQATAQTTVDCQVQDSNFFGTLESLDLGIVAENSLFWEEQGLIHILGVAEENQLDPIFLPDEVDAGYLSWFAPYDGQLTFDFTFTDITNNGCFVAYVLVNGVGEPLFGNHDIVRDLNQGDELRATLYWLPDIENCDGNAGITLQDFTFTYDCSNSVGENQNSCLGDLDYSGVINTADLMVLLAQFGELCD